MPTAEHLRPQAREKVEVGIPCAGRAQWWPCILNIAMVLWILRVPVATTTLGWVLLGATPQAQDLFLEFSNPRSWRTWTWMVWFVLVLMLAWALPTHYAARMLVDTDPKAPAKSRAQCLMRS